MAKMQLSPKYPIGEVGVWKNQTVQILTPVIGHSGVYVVRTQQGCWVRHVALKNIDIRHCRHCGAECPGGLLTGALCADCSRLSETTNCEKGGN